MVPVEIINPDFENQGGFSVTSFEGQGELEIGVIRPMFQFQSALHRLALGWGEAGEYEKCYKFLALSMQVVDAYNLLVEKETASDEFRQMLAKEL